MNNKSCPQCQADNPDDAAFCVGCGSPFSAESRKTLCPHCNAEYTPGNDFCESCGMAIPRRSSGPRVVTEDTIPTSSIGRSVMTADLKKSLNQVFGVLLLVGIFQLFGGFVLTVLAEDKLPTPQARSIMITMMSIGVGFIVLAIWARWQPLPAAIIGLTAYCTLILIDIVAYASQLKGTEEAGSSRPPINLMQIIIIAALGKGIQEAVKYRRLKASEEAGKPIA